MLFLNASKYGLEGSDYILKIYQATPVGLLVYIHPSDRGGDTTYFMIQNNSVMEWNIANTEENIKAILIKRRLENETKD